MAWELSWNSGEAGISFQPYPELIKGKFHKKKSRALMPLLCFGVPLIPFFSPAVLLFLGIEPGPKRCTRIRELNNVL